MLTSAGGFTLMSVLMLVLMLVHPWIPLIIMETVGQHQVRVQHGGNAALEEEPADDGLLK